MRPDAVSARLRCNNPACVHEWTITGTITACPKCKNTKSTLLRIDLSRPTPTGGKPNHVPPWRECLMRVETSPEIAWSVEERYEMRKRLEALEAWAKLRILGCEQAIAQGGGSLLASESTIERVNAITAVRAAAEKQALETVLRGLDGKLEAP